MSIYFPFLSTESDETLSKWRWHNVKKVGMTPCPRSGISSVGVPGTNKVLFFGGVQDVEENDTLDVNTTGDYNFETMPNLRKRRFRYFDQFFST